MVSYVVKIEKYLSNQSIICKGQGDLDICIMNTLWPQIIIIKKNKTVFHWENISIVLVYAGKPDNEMLIYQHEVLLSALLFP